MAAELAPYQTRLARASEIRAGDFLDYIERAPSLRGPRGGKYRFAGTTVRSRVKRVAWIGAGRHEYDERPWGDLVGMKIVPATGPAFVLPGNLCDLTGAVVRRSAD